MSSTKELEMLTIPSRDGERVTSIVMSPVPDFMGAILAGAPPKVFSLVTGHQVKFPVSAPVTGLAFRPRSEAMPTNEVAVAIGAQTGEVRRLDLELGIGLIPVFMPRANCVAYSHEGRYLAGGSTDGLVWVYDLTGPATDKPESRFVKTDQGMRQVWSQGRPLLDGPPKEVLKARVGRACVTSVTFDSASETLFVTTAEGKLLWFTIDQPEREAKDFLVNADDGKPFDWDCYCVGAHPKAPLVAVGGKGGNVYLTSMQTPRKLVTLTTSLGSFVSGIEFLVADKQIVMLGANGVEVWNLSPLGPVPHDGKVAEGKRALAARQYGKAVFVTQA